MFSPGLKPSYYPEGSWTLSSRCKGPFIDFEPFQLHSIHSASSDRSSLSSGSPDTSPIQHQIQPVQQVTPSISLSPASSNTYLHSGVGNYNQAGFQQPSAARTRKVIPIINPNTGMTLTSPPNSISPGQMQNAQRRW